MLYVSLPTITLYYPLSNTCYPHILSSICQKTGMLTIKWKSEDTFVGNSNGIMRSVSIFFKMIIHLGISVHWFEIFISVVFIRISAIIRADIGSENETWCLGLYFR